MISEQLWAELCQVEGVSESPSSFGEEPALWVNGKEVAHREGRLGIDIRLTRGLIRAQRAELGANPAVTLRASSSSDWLEVTVGDRAAEALVLELVQQAAAAHRAEPGRRAAAQHRARRLGAGGRSGP
ncbi:MAG TPA: luciferase family protein [Acidimicrobiales bacterium]|jgi:hypothetical protein|nr:luciferase family protein [Acidimicrobiales bacterium]